MRVVVCLRGGYGVHRIADEFDFAASRGFSGITALHVALWREARAVHCAHPAFDDPATVALGVPAVLDADGGTLVTEALGR